MTTEEKVDYLEDKLTRTIALLKLIVSYDKGLTKDDTDWLIKHIDRLTQLEN